jgi:hypothetical protein
MCLGLIRYRISGFFSRLLDDKRLQYREAIAGFEVFPKPYTAGQLIEKVKEVLATARGGAKDQGP